MSLWKTISQGLLQQFPMHWQYPLQEHLQWVLLVVVAADFFLSFSLALFFIISWLYLYLHLWYCGRSNTNIFNSHSSDTLLLLQTLPVMKLIQFLVLTFQFGCCEALCLLSTTFPVCTWTMGWHCGYVSRQELYKVWHQVAFKNTKCQHLFISGITAHITGIGCSHCNR